MSSKGTIIPKTRSKDHIEDVEIEERNLALSQKRTPNSRKSGYRATKDSTGCVRSKAPYGERCTISLDGDPCLEDCHVVSRSTKSNILECLEYAWGYHYRQFNVDTSDNIILMRGDWHRMYDARHWMLVPTPNMVEAIYTHCMKSRDTLDSSGTANYPPINQAYPMAASYEYYVLAVNSMSEVIINRLRLKPDAEGNPAIPPHRFHRFPFKTLGLIKSHVLPQYAIFNCGRKLRVDNPFDLLARYELLTDNAVEARNALSQITELYKLWTTLPVPPAFKKTFEMDLRQIPDDSSSSSDAADNNFKPPRARSALKKRKASPQSPTPASGSRMGSNSGANKRRARHIVLPSPYDSDSECSINSDMPLTEAEVTEMHDSLKLVSSWRTASSKEFSQGYQNEKAIASRKDIGEHRGELSRKASPVDLNPEGPPVDYYPSHRVAAALEKIESLNR